MALDKAGLEAKLIQIFSDPQLESNVEIVAEKLANAIDEFVKTGNAVGVDSRGDTHNLTIQ